MRKCRFCAEEIQDAAVVCKHCGRDLVPGRSTVQSPPPVVVHAPPKKARPGAVVLGVLGGLLFIGWCASQISPPSSTRVLPDASSPETADAAQRDARHARSQRYFQRMLITFGDDMTSTFGGELASLGLKGRELQAMPVAQAYALTHDAAMRIGDVAMRRRYLSDLFNEVEEP